MYLGGVGHGGTGVCVCVIEEECGMWVGGVCGVDAGMWWMRLSVCFVWVRLGVLYMRYLAPSHPFGFGHRPECPI